MTNLLFCLSRIALLVSVWALCGLGPLLALSAVPRTGPRFRQLRALLALSPLIGYLLVSCAGLVRLNLLLPLSPALVVSSVAALSLLLVAAFYRRLASLLKRQSAGSWLMLILPAFIYVVCFSSIFFKNGLELLSGAQDELLYSTNAAQMLIQNTLGKDDLIAPRVDHWTYDLETRYLPYCLEYRRGAEVLLAESASLLRLPPTLTFPILCGSLFAVIIISFGFIGRDCLRFNRTTTSLLQCGMALLSCLTIFHVQGCLAYVTAMAPVLTGLSLAAIAFRPRSHWGTAGLCGIMLGGVMFTYTEVASFEAVFPAAFVIVERLARSRFRLTRTLLAQLAAFVLFFASVANQSLCNFWPQLSGNAGAVAQAAGVKQLPRRNEIGEVDAICGAVSYYDTSRINRQMIAFSNGHQALVAVLAVVFLYLPSAYGFLRLGARVRALQVAYFTLLAILCAVAGHDSFRLFRGLEYSMPYVLIGLFMVAARCRLRPRPRLRELAFAALLSAFLLMNFCTDLRTYAYLRKFDNRSDPVIRRYSPFNADFQRLTKELSRFPESPVLIAGFTDTTRPHRIVVAIEPHPNFLSRSITAFWPILLDRKEVLLRDKVLRYRTPRKPLHELVPLPDWERDQAGMIARARQAIVPRNGEFPAEWQTQRDIYPHRRSFYPNLCDLVYRDEFALTLAPGRAGPLSCDDEGQFRLLASESRLILKNVAPALYEFAVTFDGRPESLAVAGVSAASNITVRKKSKGRQSTVQIYPLDKEQLNNISLAPLGDKPLKVRRISLRELILAR